ncbi:hypothetical protein FHR81_002573 [Actinoalloteichus hoggarensis]|uniref:Uncharacterized protein n=1 Tax=Actinoalloteichus hoggarensis TaxID=1470176 RepID=A0A221VXI3_9PSEU|nr:hypothetical protein AHOG_02565 [Actinoalloteichus hoggarensis]MBB5921533.1 hypothetical protein [Actinoalloteichus hoggarensis]
MTTRSGDIPLVGEGENVENTVAENYLAESMREER